MCETPKAQLGIGGNITVYARDVRTGSVTVSRTRNLIVDSGLNHARDLFAGGAFKPDELAAGSSKTATTAGMTALVAERVRKTITRRNGKTPAKIIFQAFVPAGEGGSFAVWEVGLFEKSTMIGRGVLTSAINKTALVELTLVYEITFSAVT